MFATQAEQGHLTALRRKLHRHPELAFKERETAAVVRRELERLGIEYRYDGVGSGVIASLETDPALPWVALRADMDALPGDETTGAAYDSLHPGRMHACGHDAHMTMVLGAAARLVESPPSGNVRFIFQPAEERGGGSRTVIAAGALDGVSAIFGGHVTQTWPAGKIMVRDGTMTAQSDALRMDISGASGHGARPHEAIDAVVVAALTICALQTLVSRNVNPLHPAVITIGKVEAGSAGNVIAERALLQGSIRSTLAETRDHLHRGIRRMGEAMAELHGGKIEVEIRPGYPPVVNTEQETALARAAVRAAFGDDALVTSEHPSMGSEDFAFYLDHVPGCFVRFGARPPGQEPVPLHSQSFDIDEETLAVGACYYDTVARMALEAYG